MIADILTVAVPAVLTGVTGYAVGRLHLGHYKDCASDLARTVANLRQDLANTRQSYLRQLDGKDSAIRTLNHRLVPLEAREKKRLAHLNSIARKGAIAMHAKRREDRKEAGAMTLAAIATNPPRPRDEVVKGVIERRKQRLTKSDAGKAAA